jgi:hypothetical protein
MEQKNRESLIVRLMGWHEKDQHRKIIIALESYGRENWDYELSSFYARALNNVERYQEALDVLLPLRDQGKGDGVWYFRVGYSLYYLNREAEAVEYFQKAIDYGDDGEDTRTLLEVSREEAEMRRKQENKGSQPEVYSEGELRALERHVEKHFGMYKNVVPEFESPDIHVDIVIIEPTPKRNYYVLMTMGMGAHRMHVPEGLEDQSRAELLICLPPDWNLRDLDDDRWSWPLHWLKLLARLPIDENSWLGWGHTIPNDEPFAQNTGLCTIMLLNPGAFDDKASVCRLPGGDIVNFYQMIPLYKEEARFKLKNNAQIFLQFLDQSALEYVRIDRENICAE